MIPNSTKETCKSISQEPLLPGISIDKFNGEPLHIYQGKLTHQNSETFMKLNKESNNAEGEYFYNQAELCQQYIIDTLELEESVEFVDAKKLWQDSNKNEEGYGSCDSSRRKWRRKRNRSS